MVRIHSGDRAGRPLSTQLASRCRVPHSRHQKWIESRRVHGFGVSQTGHSVSFWGKGRSQWSQETGPLTFTSSSQLTSLQLGQRQHTAISFENVARYRDS